MNAPQLPAELTPEQLNYLTRPQHISTLHEPVSPRAKCLAAEGYHRQALRADECGMVRFWRCSNDGTIEREMRKCMSKFCPFCSKQLTYDRVDAFTRNWPYMANLPEFTIVEVQRSWTGVPCGECIQQFGRDVKDWLKTFADPRDGTGAHTNLVIRSDGPSHALVAKILFWGQIDYKRWTSMADAQSRYTRLGVSRLDDMLHYVLDPECPKSSELQAKYEIAFHGIRAIRASGNLSRKELVTPEDSYNYSPSAHEEQARTEAAEARLEDGVDSYLQELQPSTANNDKNTTTCTSRRCRTCGKDMPEFSQWTRDTELPASVNDLAWFRTKPPE